MFFVRFVARLFFTSVLAAVLLATFSGCGTVMEKNQVRTPAEHLYSVRDPQFRRSVEALLEPAMLPGKARFSNATRPCPKA